MASLDAPSIVCAVDGSAELMRIAAELAELVDARLDVVHDPAERRALLIVSSRLTADAPCPVLVVPPRLERFVQPLGWRGRTLVSGFDGSVASWGAARHAATLAELLEGALSVVSVGTGVRGDDVLDG